VVAGLVSFVAGRVVSMSIAWAIVLALGSAAFCFIADGGALLLHGLAQFFHDF
jgi:low affinity Fe/Cu permease